MYWSAPRANEGLAAVRSQQQYLLEVVAQGPPAGPLPAWTR